MVAQYDTRFVVESFGVTLGVNVQVELAGTLCVVVQAPLDMVQVQVNTHGRSAVALQVIPCAVDANGTVASMVPSVVLLANRAETDAVPTIYTFPQNAISVVHVVAVFVKDAVRKLVASAFPGCAVGREVA